MVLFSSKVAGDESVPHDFAYTVLELEITPFTGKSVSTGKIVTDGSVVTVDWGDGSYVSQYSSSTDSRTGEQYVSSAYHTYSSYGRYTVRIGGGATGLRIVPEDGSGYSPVLKSRNPMAEALCGLTSVGSLVTALSASCFENAERLVVSGQLLHDGAPISIGDRCFAGCNAATSFSGVARYVSTSGKYAFSGCRALSNVDGLSRFNPLAEGSFSGCTSLTRANLDSMFTKANNLALGARIFEKCTGITGSIFGPYSGLYYLVQNYTGISFGEYAFAGCTGITNLNTYYANAATNKGYASLPKGCFYRCTGMTSARFTKGGCLSCGDECFMYTSLANIEGFIAVRTFGARCFYGIRNLRSIGSSYLPPATSFGDECFMRCVNLPSLANFPSTVTTLGKGVFRECYERSFNSDGQMTGETGLANATRLSALPSLAAVPDYAFFGDGKLTSVSFHANTTKIGAYAFSGCFGFKDLSFVPLTLGTNGADPGTVELPEADGLGAGAFSHMYDPPHYVYDSTVPPESEMPIHYGGLVDASRLSSLWPDDVTWFPDSLLEGNMLLSDVFALPAQCTRIGDRCFADCRSLYTLDAFADPDLSGFVCLLNGTRIVPHAVKFGKECFAGCAWPEQADPDDEDAARTGEDVKPAVDTMVYDTSQDQPEEEFKSGLAFIGGIRRYYDRAETHALKCICDYYMDADSVSLSTGTSDPMRSIWTDFSEDCLSAIESYRFPTDISYYVSYAMDGLFDSRDNDDRPRNHPFDGIRVALNGGACGTLTLAGISVGQASYHVELAYALVPVYDDETGVIESVELTVPYIMCSDGSNSRARQLPTESMSMTFQVSEVAPTAAETLNNQDISDEHKIEMSVGALSIRVGFRAGGTEYSTTVGNNTTDWVRVVETTDEGGMPVEGEEAHVNIKVVADVVNDGSILRYAEDAISETLTGYYALDDEEPDLMGTLYATMYSLYKRYWAFGYLESSSLYFVEDYFGNLSGLITFLDSLPGVDEFRKFVTWYLFSTPAGVPYLGEGCFDGCTELEIEDHDDETHGHVEGEPYTFDGFPKMVIELPARLFRNTGVALSGEFSNAQVMGDGCFASSGVTSLALFPKYLTSVSAECFSGCSSLASLSGPHGKVTSFGVRAFAGCSSLSDVKSGPGYWSVEDCLDAKETSFPSADQRRYSGFFDRFRYAHLITSIGKEAFRDCVSLQHLYYTWSVPDVGDPYVVGTGDDAVTITPEHSIQEFVKSVFQNRLTVQGTGLRSSDLTQWECLLRFAPVSGGDEIVFECTVDLTSASGSGAASNSNGFDWNGAAIRGKCVKSVKVKSQIGYRNHTYYPQYSSIQGREEKVMSRASNSTGYFTVLGDYSMRAYCANSWDSSPTYGASETLTPATGSDNRITMVVGPYRVTFDVYLKATLTLQGTMVVTNATYTVAGLKAISVTRLPGAEDGMKVPVFPLLYPSNGLGTGCFAGCTGLKSLEGLEHVTAYPARCFAGCPFTHPVQDPEVHAPVVTASMPVYDDRKAWCNRLVSAVRPYSTYERNSDYVIEKIKLRYSSSDEHQIVVLVSVDDDGVRSYSCESGSETLEPITFDEDEYTLEFVSADDDKIVVKVSDEVTIKVPTVWDDDSEYVSVRTAVLLEDTVQTEMSEYLAPFQGIDSVGCAANLGDFAYAPPRIVSQHVNPVTSEIEEEVVPYVFTFRWSRTDGTWSVANRYAGYAYVAETEFSKSVKFPMQSQAFADLVGEGYEVECPSCPDGEEWKVVLKAKFETVEVATNSVSVPSTVTSIASTTFSFDDYPDAVQKLKALYFRGRTAAAVSAMTNFPFGIPSGCSIYADGSLVYTAP